MIRMLLLTSSLFLGSHCSNGKVNTTPPPDSPATVMPPATFVKDIPLPAGYRRVPQPAGSFGAWLRQRALKADHTVYLFDGRPKRNQEAQYAVLDISVGDKDLQQCADAVIRLYAEYQYSSGQSDKIAFKATDGTRMDYHSWQQGIRFVLKQGRLQRIQQTKPDKSAAGFSAYLQTVFMYAGTQSLSRELQPVTAIRELMPGDVFIRGGSPGHAVIVMDVAQNDAGHKIFLLAQSYMPAQNIHILKNPMHATPWYPTSFTGRLITPEWIFERDELKKFP
ncbi:DUF4846 domain-containing protein [Chitinophaga nivalis]|uniref:DUF4846 domain-containing protein n=1 Tax=Chitinophaga nivalis TaxID=2991709 RepID=A0ABT3IP15_9BACT|nr:DUF4846 domain-containing protein [Chitinophaga nivalis]MCW3464591.1 DUF4846 domain-containing protein [Chitinophaga nivalis]MCW3485718.1 DUF4846 domain-containing protein [Chitinophaga nivalis]